jgi:hypothetical protein
MKKSTWACLWGSSDEPLVALQPQYLSHALERLA